MSSTLKVLTWHPVSEKPEESSSGSLVVTNPAVVARVRSLINALSAAIPQVRQVVPLLGQ